MFNFVNYVDQIELDPLSSKNIIIAFLPDDKNAEDAVQSSEQFQPEEETYDYNEINGLVFFVCYKDAKKLGLVQQQVNPIILPIPEKSMSVKPRSDLKSFSRNDLKAAESESSPVVTQPDYQVHRFLIYRSPANLSLASANLSFPPTYLQQD